MADSKKRWTVTYTKHVKQKRKAYQDGFLVLNVSTGKLSLYDECEKLLECRILKNDETVESGESLTFNGHLVDIGSLEGENKPQPHVNVDIKQKNVSRFRTPDVKSNAKETIARTRKPLSPSQKIIKEFKKREILKYESPKISYETPKPSTTTEWQVLYTSQMTQKAKKYHDGFVELVLSGSRGAQVRLFDANRNLLDSRFLKKDDSMKPGESISFDTYLVDISEDQGSHTPDSIVKEGNCTNVQRIQKIDRQQTSLDTDTDTHVTVGKREWQVLYTTQLTQKAKKFHDGFLQLELCGSLGRQVILYDLSKRPLERRFLKKDEVIRAGELLYFAGHLVDVGEPEGSHQSPVKSSERETGGENVVEKRQLRHGERVRHKIYPSIAKEQQPSSRPCLRQDAGLNSHFSVIEEIKSNKTVVKPSCEGQPSSRSCLRQDAGLSSHFAVIEEIKSNKTVPVVKPLRDADQILSFLQDPNDCYVKGGRSPIRSYQNILDRESTEIVKSPDITSTKAACDGGRFQFRESVKMSNQAYSDKKAQENIDEANFDLLLSSPGGHSSCPISNEGETAEEFSLEREAFPSFDLGF
ncbi:DDE family endonuclease [Trifolium repens]|nr:DDE family endonuclease [Trifolium repens]